ncbi:esterase-like activity of phytase family protein [Microbulbifer sp. CnH-101-G]|uniref:esterase-like activity of phytase family protein n=1 Tax=Microbulbifer sp. CnH-101-G TaxID=3243393 RepID=UPI00403A04CC
MIKRFLFSITLVLLSPLVAAVEITPAKLQASYWVDNSEGLDISGLSFCAGKLLAVSDKNSGEIYALALDGDRAELRSHLLLADLGIPSKDQTGSLWVALTEFFRPAGELDFEGISCADDTIHLVSEHYNRIANVDAQGRANWQEHIWSPKAREQGYLQKPNASSEGLVKAGDTFWVAMERDPRGLLRLNANGEVRTFTLPPVSGLDFYGRSEDLTGLDYYDGALFTLERNAHAVCRREPSSLKAQWCVDYRELEESPERIYEETRYGKGEGLAVNSQGIFVVLDNNNVGRAQAPEDKRALLLHLAFPESNH